MVLEPAEAVGGDEGEDHGGGDDGPLDDVEDKAEAVAAHAGLDELRLEALDLLVDSTRAACGGCRSWLGFLCGLVVRDARLRKPRAPAGKAGSVAMEAPAVVVD